MFLKAIIATFVTQLGFSAVGLAHTYKIFNHPPNDQGVSCSERAAQYAGLLNNIEGVTVLGGICEVDGVLNRRNIIIRYDAAEPLAVVSTYANWAIYDHRGVYKSERECLNALYREEQIFTEETGLEVFASFCTQENLQKSRPWYAHIDGFGRADRLPGRASWNSNRIYGITYKTLFDEISRSIGQYDLSLKHLVLRPNAAYDNSTITFYGSKQNVRIRFSSKEVMSIRGLGACQGQVSNLRGQLQNSKTISLTTAYCSSPYSNPTRFELTMVWPRGSWIDRVYSSETFDSFDACLSNEQRITSQMRAAYGEQILAGVCGNRAFDRGRQPSYSVIGLIQN